MADAESQVVRMVLDAVAVIPGADGWWKSRSADTYQELAEMLLSRGVPGVQVVEILTSAFSAAADEFGA